MIEVKNLTKRYGKNVAVEGLTFTVEDGKIYGFLGPNGAGKSTTMNIITGCLAATEGTVTVDGYDIFEDPIEAKRLIGYLPEQPPLYMDMTPYEFLTFVAQAKGVAKADIDRQVEESIEATDIAEMRDRLIKNLSKGYRQRVGIAMAMLGDPHVIILDEPTVGLDPAQIIEIRELIRRLGERHTVILSSHILSEVSAVCDEVLIISHGRLIANEKLENLGKILKTSSVLRITVKGEEDAIRAALDGMEGVEKTEFVPSPNEEGCYDACLTVSDGYDLREEAMRRLVDVNLFPLSTAIEKANLEEIFLALTNDVPTEEAASGSTLDVDADADAVDLEENVSDETNVSAETDVSDETNVSVETDDSGENSSQETETNGSTLFGD